MKRQVPNCASVSSGLQLAEADELGGICSFRVIPCQALRLFIIIISSGTQFTAPVFLPPTVWVTFLNTFILAISVSDKDILFCHFTRRRTVRKAFNNSYEYSWAKFSVQIFCLPKTHFWSTEAVCALKSLGVEVNNVLSEKKKKKENFWEKFDIH